MLGLHFCARAFSSCGERGSPFFAVRGPLTIAASLVAEHKLQTRGIFPDQGSNLCPLHRQADSKPLHHQGSPLQCLSLTLRICSKFIRAYNFLYALACLLFQLPLVLHFSYWLSSRHFSLLSTVALFQGFSCKWAFMLAVS